LPLLALAVLIVAGSMLASVERSQAERIQGSGSTFAFPVISAWTKSFLEFRAAGSDFVFGDIGVDYEPIGSLGGVMRLAQPEVDFAASDAPFPPEELAKLDLAQFPIVIGGLAVVVNLEAVEPGRLKLSGDVLAQIYLGKVTSWNDPAIVAVNPDLSLPDLPIAVVHRGDGSGSTLTWTRYLSAASAEWRECVGADTLVEWPKGTVAEGTAGMIAAVKQTAGAIGYMEFGQVGRAGLVYAQVGNRSGNFIAPGAEIFAATAAKAAWDPERDFYLELTEVDAADAYPLTAATFVMMHKSERSVARTRRTLFFLSHALERGGEEAAGLGYVPLPEPLVRKVKDYWHSTLPGGAGL
jgi:phosphate transport system substrate-binding protein